MSNSSDVSNLSESESVMGEEMSESEPAMSEEEEEGSHSENDNVAVVTEKWFTERDLFL